MRILDDKQQTQTVYYFWIGRASDQTYSGSAFNTKNLKAVVRDLAKMQKWTHVVGGEANIISSINAGTTLIPSVAHDIQHEIVESR